MNNFYRNYRNVISDQGVEVDAGALWELDKKTEKLILIDDDEYITVDFSSEEFYSV